MVPCVRQNHGVGAIKTNAAVTAIASAGGAAGGAAGAAIAALNGCGVRQNHAVGAIKTNAAATARAGRPPLDVALPPIPPSPP